MTTTAIRAVSRMRVLMKKDLINFCSIGSFPRCENIMVHSQCTLEKPLVFLAFGRSPYQSCHKQMRLQAADLFLQALALLITIKS